VDIDTYKPTAIGIAMSEPGGIASTMTFGTLHCLPACLQLSPFLSKSAYETPREAHKAPLTGFAGPGVDQFEYYAKTPKLGSAFQDMMSLVAVY
ncbi:MAG: hypothetical protein CYPHOPRED_003192, partial [Cyphobasidiales sp. Tagirdzhanova-0007]